LRIADFDFALPPGRIAQAPIRPRDACRLLVLDRRTGARRHRIFRDLPEFLDAGDLLIMNRSRVFRARLRGTRPNGSVAEILLLRPTADAREWEALLRPGRRLHVGDRIAVAASLTVVVASEVFGVEGRRYVRLESPDEPWSAIERAGHVPLPPYIARPDNDADREDYQTVYAQEPGSVAAPTAGLHFTAPLLERLRHRGVERAELLLHVGPGTFRPVKVDKVADHRVDPEHFDLPSATVEAIEHARTGGGRVVAVGTTAVRTLESRVGTDGRLIAGAGETDCVIVPGFRFRAVDALVTNFHMPRSSLLLLVAAFAGREAILDAYAEAIREGYHFYSYGDAMLVL
jgi:S-adenosylmethionine:tRNA ribosyltransferase-isomerase